MAMVMAGGVGSRLYPLTAERTKSAVHFAGKYRIIDFVINNLINSAILKIKILTQFKSDSLNKHISAAWHLPRSLDMYIDPVPAQMRTGNTWYRGTADAIFQNINLIDDEKPDYVAVLGGDHIYKMDYNQMVDFHADSGALATIAAIPKPISEASRFGVIEVDEDWHMVGFEEKPERPKSLPNNPDFALVSMGNYLFSRKFLVRELYQNSKDRESSHDFGRDIIPKIYQQYPVYVYNFLDNHIPGETPKEVGYWQDVGTIDDYYRANLDVKNVSPIFNLYNKKWPLRTVNWNYPPAKFVFSGRGSDTRTGHALDSVVSEGCIISGATVTDSVLAPGVFVHSYANIAESVIFPDVDVGRGAKIRRAIIDRGLRIPEGAEIGCNLELDKRRFHVTENGVVVVPRSFKFEDGDSQAVPAKPV